MNRKLCTIGSYVLAPVLLAAAVCAVGLALYGLASVGGWLFNTNRWDGILFIAFSVLAMLVGGLVWRAIAQSLQDWCLGRKGGK